MARLPTESPRAAPTKILAKAFQLGLACDLLGSVMTFSAARGTELEVTPLGVKMISGKSGRVMLVPWANIKACELYPDA